MYNLHLKHVFKLGYSRCFNTKKKKTRFNSLGPKKKKRFILLIIFLKYKKISSNHFYIIEDKYFLLYNMF